MMCDEAREEDAGGMFRPKEKNSRCRSSARHGRQVASVLRTGSEQSGRTELMSNVTECNRDMSDCQEARRDSRHEQTEGL